MCAPTSRRLARAGDVLWRRGPLKSRTCEGRISQLDSLGCPTIAPYARLTSLSSTRLYTERFLRASLFLRPSSSSSTRGTSTATTTTMHHLRRPLLWLLVFSGLQETLCAPAQVPLVETDIADGTQTHFSTAWSFSDEEVVCLAAVRPRKPQGRFLHLTDMHPDPHYREGTSEKSACHRRKPKKKPRSGTFGYTYGCVAPTTADLACAGAELRLNVKQGV